MVKGCFMLLGCGGTPQQTAKLMRKFFSGHVLSVTLLRVQHAVLLWSPDETALKEWNEEHSQMLNREYEAAKTKWRKYLLKNGYGDWME